MSCGSNRQKDGMAMEQGWILFALLSAATAALVAIFGKIGLEGIDSNTATAIRGIIMALVLVGVVVAEGKITQIGTVLKNFDAMKFIFLSALAGALSWLFYFLALKMGKASQVAPIDRLSVVFVLILSTLFLGESASPKTILGTVLVAVGAILVALG